VALVCVIAAIVVVLVSVIVVLVVAEGTAAPVLAVLVARNVEGLGRLVGLR